MRRLFTALFLLFSLALFAEGDGAVELLDRAVARLKSDSGVQMEFEYIVCDAGGVQRFSEKGRFFVDCAGNKQRFALLLEQLKIWCDGKQQWNYSGQTDEIYITAADSEEAHNLSPLHIMQLYKKGYNSQLRNDGINSVVTLMPVGDESEYSKVQLYIDNVTLQPQRMRLVMGDNGYIDIVIKNHKGGCKFQDSLFVCPIKEFPNVEVVDMR